MASVIRWLRDRLAGHPDRPRRLSSAPHAAVDAFLAPPARRVIRRQVDESPWATEAVEAHRAQVTERCASRACERCGQPLTSATLLGEKDGASHDDLRLTQESTAKVLAATERLLVQCLACGHANVL
jgi:hypothetical protein